MAAASDVNAVARAIMGALSKAQLVEAHAIGAGAVNQAVKAVAIARRSLERSGQEIFVTPGFIEVEVDGKDRTGIRLIIECRQS